jgi:hypothetical protein
MRHRGYPRQREFLTAGHISKREIIISLTHVLPLE